jgi:hypothetical protein
LRSAFSRRRPNELQVTLQISMRSSTVAVPRSDGAKEVPEIGRRLQAIRGPRRITVAGDKGYDTAAFVASCRTLNITPHVAQNERRPGGSALDLRTTSRPGYAVSQRVRKRVEEIFG